MTKRWDAVVITQDNEELHMVLRGATEERARENGLAYGGVKEVKSLKERIVEKTFPEAPSHLIDIHYRPLRRQDGKILYG